MLNMMTTHPLAALVLFAGGVISGFVFQFYVGEWQLEHDRTRQARERHQWALRDAGAARPLRPAQENPDPDAIGHEDEDRWARS